MDVQAVNEVGITLAGILGLGLFYWVGKKHSQRSRDRKPEAGTEQEKSGQQEKK